MTELKKNQLKIIEEALENMPFEQIPKQFVDLIEEKFDTYSYLKSLLELKKSN